MVEKLQVYIATFGVTKPSMAEFKNPQVQKTAASLN